jgi:hypothetical protein
MLSNCVDGVPLTRMEKHVRALVGIAKQGFHFGHALFDMNVKHSNGDDN